MPSVLKGLGNALFVKVNPREPEACLEEVTRRNQALRRSVLWGDRRDNAT